MRSLFEDARRENRVLFEDALSRITTIQERRPPRRKNTRSGG